MASFTKQQLFQIRNDIDVDWLINEQLHIKRQFNRIWRFQCPVCQQFNTATQKKNNLARCFSCQQNFNTIDLVIYSRKLNFVPSIEFLLSLLEKQLASKSRVHNLSAEKKGNKTQNRNVGLQAIKKMKQIMR